MEISKLNTPSTKKNEEVNFSGIKREYNTKMEDVYKFYAPPYDKSKYEIFVELAPIKENGHGGFQIDRESGSPFVLKNSAKQLEKFGSVEYSREIPLANPEDQAYMGYRFKLVSKSDIAKAKDAKEVLKMAASSDNILYDAGITNDGFTVVSNTMGMTPKSGSSAHIFYDAYDSAQGVDRSTFVRNHFNKAGGDLDSILKYKDEIKPYRYVMTNPYMGRDTRSSHKYWGEEFFKMPDTAKFKELNTELFKEGKGYIADGAITSMSIQSPILHHVLKYGEKSPFKDWFKLNGDVKLGVLPDSVFHNNQYSKNALDNLGFKVVNPKGVEGVKYDPDKPSYIQFYDKTLASKAQQTDSKTLIDAYANANPEDHYDIAVHQDSVLPYFFEIDYSNDSVEERFSGYTNKSLSEVDDINTFFTFDNFSITTKERSGGAEFWDGNVDMVKMNLSNANTLGKNRAGQNDVREHLYKAASHWTQFVDDSLVEATAKELASGNIKEIEKIALANDISLEDLEALMAAALDESSPLNKESVDKDEYIGNIVNKFNYETLDLSPQVAPIFVSPEFSQAINNPKNVEALTEYVEDVLEEIDSKTEDAIFEDDSLTAYGQYMADLVGEKVITFAALKAIAPEEKVYIDKDDALVKTSKELKTMSLSEIGIVETGNPINEIRQMSNLITKNISEASDDETYTKEIANSILSAGYKDITLNDFKQARALVNKAGGGLNWRFDAAKDITDLNSAKDGLVNFEKTWDNVIDFWSNFVTNIREVNPSSYIVGEITYPGTFQGYGKYGSFNAAERMFFEKTGATTGSNYSHFFGLIPETLGMSLEFGGVSGDRYGNLNGLKNSMEGFVNSGPILSTTHSHVFVDNHDKPRALHMMAIDAGAYLSGFGYGKETTGRAIEAVEHVAGKDPDRSYDNLSSKGMVVGSFLKGHFGEALAKNPEEFKAISQAIAELSYGKKSTQGKIDFKRAEAFGQTPFDIAINDILDRAEKIDKDVFKKVDREKLSNKIFADSMEPALRKMENMSDFMVGLTGMPFYYAGTNLGQTGYEYATKNISVANRNLIRHEWIDPKAKEFKPEIKTFYDRMQASASLYKQAGLSAIASGMPVLLQEQENSEELYAVYKYDDKGSNVLQVFSNIGLEKDAKGLPAYNKDAQTGVGSIKVVTKEGDNVVLSGSNGNAQVMHRKVYQDGKFVDETENGKVVTYKIKNGALTRTDGKQIVLDSTLSTFYKAQNSDPQKEIAFKANYYKSCR